VGLIIAEGIAMTLTIRAVYEGGVLRPMEPLALPEGQSVAVIITTKEPAAPPLRAPTPTEEDYARRIKAAKSLEEMHAIMETAPPAPNETYDIVEMINESRRLTGFRMPDSDSMGEARE
jgi:predicted DNA-binding antitoxin AbrB/MazE fold protein